MRQFRNHERPLMCWEQIMKLVVFSLYSQSRLLKKYQYSQWELPSRGAYGTRYCNVFINAVHRWTVSSHAAVAAVVVCTCVVPLMYYVEEERALGTEPRLRDHRKRWSWRASVTWLFTPSNNCPLEIYKPRPVLANHSSIYRRCNYCP